MSLITDLEKAPPRRWVMDRVFEQLDDGEQQALAEALRNPDWTHSALAETLRKAGYPVAASTIGDYRRRNGLL